MPNFLFSWLSVFLNFFPEILFRAKHNFRLLRSILFWRFLGKLLNLRWILTGWMRNFNGNRLFPLLLWKKDISLNESLCLISPPSSLDFNSWHSFFENVICFKGHPFCLLKSYTCSWLEFSQLTHVNYFILLSYKYFSLLSLFGDIWITIQRQHRVFFSEKIWLIQLFDSPIQFQSQVHLRIWLSIESVIW